METNPVPSASPDPIVTPSAAVSQAAPTPAPSTVAVVDPYGTLGTLPAANAQAMYGKGYRPATGEEIHQWNNRELYGGAGNALKAGAIGFGRGLTFGTSDLLLTKGLGVNPETIQGLTESHGALTGIGEVAGITSGLLLPGVGELGAGEGLLKTAGKAVLNPVKAAAKAGELVADSKFTSGIARGTANLFANPETSPIINKIIQGAIQTGVGSAVEGAAFGAGSHVTEIALGDPDLVSEKVLHNIALSAGIGGLLGAGFGGASAGVGGLLGKVMKRGGGGALKIGASDAAKEEVENRLAASGATAALKPETEIENLTHATGRPELTARDVLNYEGMEPAEKAVFDEALNRPKKNASEINSRSIKFTGKSAPEGILTDDPRMQKTIAALNNSDSIPGNLSNKQYQEQWQGVQKHTQAALGGEPFKDVSAFEAGDSLKKNLIERAEATYAPIRQGWDELHQELPGVSVSKDDAAALQKRIQYLTGQHNLIAGNEGVVEGFAKHSTKIDNLEKLQGYRADVNAHWKESYETRRATNLVRNELDEFENEQINKAISNLPDGEQKVRLQSQKARLDITRKLYGEQMEEYNTFLHKLVGKRATARGHQDFIHTVEEIPSEQLLSKFDSSKDAKFGDFLHEKLPEAEQTHFNYQKGQIYKNATKGTEFNPKVASDLVLNIPKERAARMFTGEELATLRDAQAHIKDLLPVFNPSGTASALNYMAQFSKGGLFKNLLDLGKLGYIKAGGLEGIAALASMERAAQSTTGKIVQGTRDLFAGAKKGIELTAPEKVLERRIDPYAGYAGSKLTPKEQKDQAEKRKKDLTASIEQIRHMGEQPEALMTGLHQSTQAMQGIAPTVTNHVQQKLSSMLGFLNSVLPQNDPNPLPLSNKLPYSDHDLSRFEKYLSGVQNPTSVLNQIKTGRIHMETMQAVQAAYPRLMQEMQAQVMSQMADYTAQGHKVPYQMKTSLSVFFGHPMDHSMEPQAILANQAALAGQAAKNAAHDQQTQMNQALKSTQSGMSKLSAGKSLLTPMQLSSQRGKSS